MKRVVLCADGTWNLRDQKDSVTGKVKPTNVTKLARAVRSKAPDGVYQVVCYHDGIGTRGGMDRWTGGAFGHGMAGNIRELYRFLVYNYDPGDEIFLFGFSRGAFTVRSLAGFLKFAGLVHKDDDFFVPEIMKCYETSCGPGSAQWKKAFGRIEDDRLHPTIRFIGVWDTVGALGAPGLLGQLLNRRKYAYHDIGLNPHIEYAVQALAVDERRVPFKPSVWNRPPEWQGTLAQAWFAGVHSNVGGGYDPDGLANEALHWMVQHAQARGLAVNEEYLSHFRPCFNSVLRDSMSAKYRIFGTNVRGVCANDDGCEAIHQSVLDRMQHPECAYHPANVEKAMHANPAPPIVDTTRIARGTPC